MSSPYLCPNEMLYRHSSSEGQFHIHLRQHSYSRSCPTPRTEVHPGVGPRSFETPVTHKFLPLETRRHFIHSINQLQQM